MDDKMKSTIANICTALGGALLLYPLIDSLANEYGPELQKLVEPQQAKEQLKMLGESKESEQKEPDKRNEYQDEMEELRRKLAEYEQKAGQKEGA